MKIIINNIKTQNKELYYEENFWSGKRTIKYNNVLLKKIKRNVYEYTNGETTHEFTLKGNLIYGLTINMFNTNVQIKEKPKWYEIILSILVFAPCALFGAIGGGIGGAFGITNLVLLDKVKKIYLKIVISLGLTIIALLLSYLFASLIFKLIVFS